MWVCGRDRGCGAGCACAAARAHVCEVGARLHPTSLSPPSLSRSARPPSQACNAACGTGCSPGTPPPRRDRHACPLRLPAPRCSHNANAEVYLPHAIVRAASNLDSIMPVAPSPDEPGVWLAQPLINEDVSVGCEPAACRRWCWCEPAAAAEGRAAPAGCSAAGLGLPFPLLPLNAAPNQSAPQLFSACPRRRLCNRHLLICRAQHVPPALPGRRRQRRGVRLQDRAVMPSWDGCLAWRAAQAAAAASAGGCAPQRCHRPQLLLLPATLVTTPLQHIKSNPPHTTDPPAHQTLSILPPFN